MCKKSFHSFNTDKKHPNRLLENLVDFYCTQLYYMVKFYSNTLKVQWKTFNKNLTSTYHKTFDLGKNIFFSVSLFFVPHPKLNKLLIIFFLLPVSYLWSKSTNLPLWGRQVIQSTLYPRHIWQNGCRGGAWKVHVHACNRLSSSKSRRKL